VARLSEKKVTLGPNSKLMLPPDFRESFEAAVAHFAKLLAGLAAADGHPNITVELLAEKHKASLGQDARQALSHREGYYLDITPQGIGIVGADALGALHGLTTLERLMLDGTGKVPHGQIFDWPDHPVRAIHAVLADEDSRDPEKVKRLIRLGRLGHFNTLVLQTRNKIQLASMAKFSRKDGWTIEELQQVVRYSRQNGLEFVPELKFLTHQEKHFGSNFPHLMYNKTTYDPRKEETYSVVLPIIDEVVTLLQPKAIHIGHDEAAGYSEGLAKESQRKLQQNEQILPSELFLQDVLRLYNHIQSKGVATWMWGDMLLAPDEFPTMMRGLHGGATGYAALRGRIPQDIVIVDWHYDERQPEFPSARALMKVGHKVIGATNRREVTIRNFSAYLFNLTRGEAGGMMATTWRDFPNSDWAAIEKLLTLSAENFWNAK
jgi:hypothetical protein